MNHVATANLFRHFNIEFTKVYEFVYTRKHKILIAPIYCPRMDLRKTDSSAVALTLIVFHLIRIKSSNKLPLQLLSSKKNPFK